MVGQFYLINLSLEEIDRQEQRVSKIIAGDLTEEEHSPDDLLKDIKGTKTTANSLYWVSLFNVIFFTSFFFLTAIRHITIVPFRSRFSFELDRFMNRIQVLASKKELAELVSLEGKVTDEDSAKAYVSHVEDIAKRHGVHDLVKELLIWDRQSG